MQNTNAISRETALRLCREIREENRGKWYTLDGLRCWWCSTFSGVPENRRFASRPDCRGCRLVDARYDTLAKPTQRQGADRAVEPADDVATEPVPFVIYLPPAGFSATQRRRVCASCGRQFRIAASQRESDYCPTCDYRRLRGQLIEQTSDDGEDG